MRPIAALLALLVTGTAFASPPGDPDLQFGTGGSVTTDFNGLDAPSAIAVHPDGTIVVGGTRLLADNYDFALARYLPDGSLDPTFGSGGKVTTDFGASGDYLFALRVLPGGKLLAIGNRTQFSGFAATSVAIARYLPNGNLDPSFGIGGRVTEEVDAGIGTAALQSDGKIVLGGNRSLGTFPLVDFLLVRFTADGALDTTFGDAGYVLTAFPAGQQDSLLGLAVLPDDRILAAGSTVISPNVDCALARYEPDGALDATFGTGGLATADLGFQDQITDVGLLADGRFVAGVTDGLTTGIARFLTDGALDPTFGSGGLVDLVHSGILTTLTLDATGDFLVAIDSYTPPAVVLRLHPDGTRDTSFGIGGALPIPVFTYYLDGAGPDATIALQPDGAILAAGRRDDTTDFTTFRFAGDHVLGCAPAPLGGCKTPSAPGRSSLQLDVRRGQSKLGWRWQRGAAVAPGELGDPTASDDYALCVYDESGAPTLVTAMLGPSAGVCDDAPCWRVRAGGTKVAYKDAAGTPLGLTQLDVKAGDAGKASVKAHAAGAHLDLPAMPVALPLRVQLHGSSGACWEATFSAAGTSRNDPTKLRARSD